MNSELMYCRYCGKQIPRTSKFCRYCGSQLSRAGSSSLPARPAENSSKSPVRAAKKVSGRRNRKAGVRATASVLVLALLFTGFIEPGFFRKKGGRTGNEISWRKTSESETLSAEHLTAVLPDSGVKLTLTPFVLEEGQDVKLNVESQSPVYAENGDYVIRPYRIDLGGIHELNDFAEIRIPYDTTFCDAGEDPAECVGGVYLNPETGEWEETLYTVDAAAGEIVIQTDHFSDFGAMTVKNRGRRDALLAGGSAELLLGEGDTGYLTESQAISTMQMMCQNGSSDTPTARLAGNQVMQAAMALGGAAAEVSDISGAAFSIGCFLDLTDNAMTGNYLEIAPEIEVWGYKLGSKLDPRYAYSNNTFNTYNNELISKSGKVLSDVGTVVSGCKLAYLAGKAASGQAEDSEIFQLYKECAGMAVNLSGSAVLSALMGPVMLADTFINYIFTESFSIKESQVQEMYAWFNEKYPGTGAPYYIRPGRGAADWRKVIIQLIDENPGADTAELLEDEINEFCNAFWELGFDEMGEVAAQCPKNIKRITDTDQKMRSSITEAYKKQLYDLLNRTVMPSVREYYNKRMVREAQKSIARAKAYYNQEISFDIFEPEHTDKKGNSGSQADNVYAGYRCCFLPLSKDAEIGNWSSVIPEKNGGLHGTFTLIGHITAGKPGYVAVFEPDADIRTAEPVLVVPFSIGGKINGTYNARIILEKEEPDDISAFCGVWYDSLGTEIQIDVLADGKLGIYNYGWTEDWLRSDYSVMPNDTQIKIYGQKYSPEKGDRLIRLLNPAASTYALSSQNEYYLCLDSTGSTLALLFAGRADSYTREKPVKENTDFSAGVTNVPPPPEWDGKSGYDVNWQLIPEGDND